MGAIGHPGDIERLRMAAIELASTEGFTRSAADVSLRRLAHYSLSPALKLLSSRSTALLIWRVFFLPKSERPRKTDFFLRLEYDGSIASHGGESRRGRATFCGRLVATVHSAKMMEHFLRKMHRPEMIWTRPIQLAVDAWSVGHMASKEMRGASGCFRIWTNIDRISWPLSGSRPPSWSAMDGFRCVTDHFRTRKFAQWCRSNKEADETSKVSGHLSGTHWPGWGCC